MNRRNFLKKTLIASGVITVPFYPNLSLSVINNPISLGFIADLHHDIMHDGFRRLEGFLQASEETKPDAIIQMGDFAYPNKDNLDVINAFNQAHINSLHVVGNHDTDNGHTLSQCIDIWGIPHRYYSYVVDRIKILVLDGNDKGSPTYKGGYPSYIGEEQLSWMVKELESTSLPVIIVSHQPLAGYISVDNAVQIQNLLSVYKDKILFAINGHSHIDHLLCVKDVYYFHVNSASYYWVGGNYKHESYPAEIHVENPWIEYTCPYQDELFTFITINPQKQHIEITAKKSNWVHQSPVDIGYVNDELEVGKEICPEIRERKFWKFDGCPEP